MGAVTPLGNNPKDTWEAMVAGKSGAAPITLFDATNFKTQFACEVKGLDVNAYIDRKEARKMDRYTQLAIIAAKQAVEDSGMDLEAEDKNRIGVVYGVGIGGIKTFEGDVSLSAVFYPPDRRRRDLDNVGGKVLIDALAFAGLFHDDFQIKRINLEMREPMENGLGVVTIGNLTNAKD